MIRFHTLSTSYLTVVWLDPFFSDQLLWRIAAFLNSSPHKLHCRKRSFCSLSCLEFSQGWLPRIPSGDDTLGFRKTTLANFSKVLGEGDTNCWPRDRCTIYKTITLNSKHSIHQKFKTTQTALFEKEDLSKPSFSEAWIFLLYASGLLPIGRAGDMGRIHSALIDGWWQPAIWEPDLFGGNSMHLSFR